VKGNILLGLESFQRAPWPTWPARRCIFGTFFTVDEVIAASTRLDARPGASHGAQLFDSERYRHNLLGAGRRQTGPQKAGVLKNSCQASEIGDRFFTALRPDPQFLSD